MQNVYKCIIMTLIISSLFSGRAAAIEFVFERDNFVHIDPNIHITGGNLFTPPPFSVGTGGDSEQLVSGESWDLNYTFDTPIRLEDTGSFNFRESFHISIDNQSGVGETLIEEGTKVNYVFELTGASGAGGDGGPISPTISISDVITTADLSGNGLKVEGLHQITNSSMTFDDLHLRLMVDTGALTFRQVFLGVDADKVSAPEPASYMLILAVLALVRFVAVKQKRLKR